MNRAATGTYQITATAGEQVRAFVPLPLPPVPSLEITGARQLLLERATLAVGRLDSISTLLPDPQLFLYSYVRREAVLSSQIEGTQSSLSDLLIFEMEEAPGTMERRSWLKKWPPIEATLGSKLCFREYWIVAEETLHSLQVVLAESSRRLNLSR